MGRQHLRIGHALGTHEHRQDARFALAGVAAVVRHVDRLDQGVALAVDVRALGAVVDRHLALEHIAEHRHVMLVPPRLLARLHADDGGGDFGWSLRRIDDGLAEDRLPRAEQRQHLIAAVAPRRARDQGAEHGGCECGGRQEAWCGKHAILTVCPRQHSA